MKWYLKVLRQYADFSGRARRKEYWMFVLFGVIFLFVAGMIDGILSVALDLQEPVMVCYVTYYFAILLPALAVVVRRLHDIGKSGWWLLIGLVPLIGGIWLFVLLVQDSEEGENQYGANPKTSPHKPSEKSRLRNVAITVTLAAIVGIINWVVVYIRPDMLINTEVWMFLSFVVDRLVLFLLFLAVGLLLFPRRSASGLFITEAQKRIAPIMIIYAAIMTLLRVLNIHFTLLFDSFGYLFSVLVYLLLALGLLFFAVALWKSDRKILRIASVTLMVVAGILIIHDVCVQTEWDITALSGIFSWRNYMFYFLSLFPVYPVSLMLLAGVFMPRKAEELEETEQLEETKQSYSFEMSDKGE
jgi:uncharacterized membrane protein YhaH (DUF805 family)